MADQHEEQNNSLRGRGRDIMRGVENDNAAAQSSGGWLPPAPQEEVPQEAPYFEDDNDLLKWMEVDPEAHRPTLAPNKRLLEPIPTDELYPEPDFDAIFGADEDEVQLEVEEQVIAPPMLAETQTLDTIFQNETPSFDDIFGEVFEDETPEPVLVDELGFLPNDPTVELDHLPDALLNEAPNLDFPDELPDWADDKRDTLIAPLVTPEYPTSAPEAIQFDLSEEDSDLDEATSMEFNLPEGEETQILREDFFAGQAPAWIEAEETAIGEATAILNQRFYEDDDLASPDEQAAFSLLDEMTEEIELPQQEGLSEAQAFVAMLEAEQTLQPDTREGRAVTAALEEPLELPALEIKDPFLESEPFGLAPETISDYDLLPMDDADYEANEAIPLGEQDIAPIDLRGVTIQTMGLPPAAQEAFEGADDFLPEAEEPFMVEDFAEETGGGTEEVTRSITEINITSPLEQAQTANVRPLSKDIFQPSPITPNQDLLGLFVDDNRLRELFEQIEALQEDIVANVRGDRGNSDIYMEELLLASNLLLSSRENYDEARAIVYRVRADLNRERRVEADIQRWSPQIAAVYMVILLGIFVLWFMKGLFVSLGENTGAEWAGYAYVPALMGLLGAWVAGAWTLYYETLVQRNFDPIRNSWYIFNNPLGGIVSGVLVYLILAATTTMTVNSDGFEAVGNSPLTWVLAAAVGFYQDSLIQALGDFRRRFLSDAGESNSTRR